MTSPPGVGSVAVFSGCLRVQDFDCVASGGPQIPFLSRTSVACLAPFLASYLHFQMLIKYVHLVLDRYLSRLHETAHQCWLVLSHICVLLREHSCQQRFLVMTSMWT